MGAGNDNRVRLQICYEFCGRFKCVDSGLDAFFFPVTYFGKDKGRVGDLNCAEDCHGETPFCIAVYKLNNLSVSGADFGETERLRKHYMHHALIVFLFYIIQQNVKKRICKIDKKSLPC
jgi:hypothetical protein